MADFGGAELDEFRTEVRDWIAANYPAELKAKSPATDPEAIWGGRAFAGSDDPQIRLDARHGLAGLDRADLAQGLWRRRAFQRPRPGARKGALAAAAVAPALMSFGLWMLGPVLLEYANEAQKKEHIPRSSAARSAGARATREPGAGSDLASLQTRCEDKGDHWLINGQKIWTSYANKADWCFCLVRTDTSREA